MHGKPIERISIVVPMLDEADHVEHLVADIASQTFAGQVEVIVADGGSTDGSRDRLEKAARAAGLDLTVIANPDRWVSHGLNSCIARASGDLIVRLDCHSRYPSDYLARCARLAETTGAWNVGGLVVAEGSSTGERAVACALQSPFGGVHWTRHENEVSPVEVDTVYCGAFLPHALSRVGAFDEGLVRNQDDELNLRIKRAGGRIVLDPTLRVRYTPRGSLRALFRQYYEYGLWKVPVMRKHRAIVSIRSLAPTAFVCSLALLAALAPASSKARLALGAELALYLSLALYFGASAIRGRRESPELLGRVLMAFGTFHTAYGLGMVRAFLLGVPAPPASQGGGSR
jgi:glycosyltransferase involved in cell wall biosynthesis